MPRHYLAFRLGSPEPKDEFRERPDAVVTDIVEQHGGTLMGLAFDPKEQVGHAIVDTRDGSAAGAETIRDELEAIEDRSRLSLLSPGEWRRAGKGRPSS
jgi:hypothetical protein